MNLRELAESRIVMDEDICSGKPRIKGTRVTVADVLLALAEGMSHQDILRNFRSLMPQDIQAAIAYAFCVSDNIKLQIASSFGAAQLIAGDGPEMAMLPSTEDMRMMEHDAFSQALEEQASIQEEITQEKVAQIKAKKIKKAKAPTISKKEPPKERPYDLLIDISTDKSSKIYSNQEQIEQALDMNHDNYIFESREDGRSWLTYSGKDGVEIDQAMKRNLLVTYRDEAGNLKEAVFEGYLTTDRQHKIFLQRDADGKISGRAL